MDRREMLRRAGFARDLSDEALGALVSIAVPRDVPRGALITLEGEPATAMYLLAEGRVKVVRYSGEGREQIMHVVEPGDHFNTVTVFDGSPCPATTEALLPSRLLVLHHADMQELIRRYPELAQALLRELAGRLRMLVGLVEDIALHSVHGRLAKLLLKQAQAAEQGRPQLPLTQAEMAAHLGTVREMVGRSLKSFEAAGLIAMDRGMIQILDRAGLAARAEM